MKKIFAFLSVFLVTQSVFADMTCDANVSKYRARYETNSYTCQNGQYLPSNAIACIACPSGFTCNGGTFDFNPDIFQGISFTSVPSSTMNNICAANFPTKLRAKYAPNSHTCSAGQYLPAGVDECTQCPVNSYCVGGTYSFNENINQGIVACDNGYHSSAGASSASDCVANVITINWSGADAEDIVANNAGQCTYGGDIRTPVKAQHVPGMTFVGWTFDVQQ